ncbi:MAG TPA: NAD(P)/FAD-dependent oxidoreductase, partial [Candidatus Poseidoniia archaeon]|nr:NAD(P)/FAD-dependent oxidoreductase [Candidatus Poseidoniia archaeon]
MEWDVIVVGAGPGGSTAARFAAEGGARTLLLEKRAEVGVPVRCGEGIAPRWLEMIGVKVEGDWVTNRVRGARIYSPNGTCLTVDDDNLGTEVGAVISRAGLDQHLADLAADAGAEVRTGTTVTELLRDGDAVTGVCIRNLNGSKEELRCGVVVGADGFESQVGRWAGLPTHRKPADMCGA